MRRWWLQVKNRDELGDESCHRRLTNSSGGDERGKSDIGRQDGAQEYSSKAVHDGNGVLRSTVVGDSSDPRGERKHAIPRDSKDETGRSDSGDTCVEDESNDGENGHEDGRTLAESQCVNLGVTSARFVRKGSLPARKVAGHTSRTRHPAEVCRTATELSQRKHKRR